MSEASVTPETKSPRPHYRNIHISQIVTYRLPPAGKVSILHRISGALLFVSLPFVLFLFDRSLTSELSFDVFRDFVSGPIARVAIWVVASAYGFHFLAGLRHLFMDLDKTVEKQGGNRNAVIVLVAAALLSVVIGLKLLGVF